MAAVGAVEVARKGGEGVSCEAGLGGGQAGWGEKVEGLEVSKSRM